MASLCLLRNVSTSVSHGMLGKNFPSRTILSVFKLEKLQSAGLALKALRDFDYAVPFPYKEQKYGFFAALFDKTTWRFNENSKIIVIDGPVAGGKSKLAKEVAEAYDLLYMPHAHLDSRYINDYGYDMRQVNDQLPFKCRSFDIHEFLQNPKDERTCIMQHVLYQIRLMQYIDAVNHVLNTGQGVVLDRSIFSDSVFVDTFVKFGFLPETYKAYINKINEAIMPQVVKPHLIIYLDTPVDITLQRIQERNLPGENNSPVYKPQVLHYMENAYKQYLKKMEKNCELLVYDWSVERNSEIVIEDLEEVNLDEYPFTDPKLEDWRKDMEYEWTGLRQFYSENKIDHFYQWTHVIPNLYCKELLIEGEDKLALNTVWENAPGMKYATGFNTAMGDPSPLFKL